nr:hypothetical protein BaRGS_009352 [Batillaria attramentaria]
MAYSSEHQAEVREVCDGKRKCTFHAPYMSGSCDKPGASYDDLSSFSVIHYVCENGQHEEDIKQLIVGVSVGVGVGLVALIVIAVVCWVRIRRKPLPMASTAVASTGTRFLRHYGYDDVDFRSEDSAAYPESGENYVNREGVYSVPDKSRKPGKRDEHHAIREASSQHQGQGRFHEDDKLGLGEEGDQHVEDHQHANYLQAVSDSERSALNGAERGNSDYEEIRL